MTLVERLRSAARAFEIGLVQLVVAAALYATLSNAPAQTAAPAVRYSLADHPAFADPALDDVEWTAGSIFDVPRMREIGWIRWRVDVPAATGARPMALLVSGPFSAEIYWNGRLVGRKGALPDTNARERPGEIDAVFAIPPDLIRPEGNVAAIRAVSTRAGYEPAVMLQSLHVAPYRADSRRSLRYYAPTILLSSGLLALACVIALLAWQRFDRRTIWLLVAIAGLVIALCAEISRALVDYPYDWHLIRQATAMAGYVGFAFALLGFAVQRWPGPPRFRTAIMAAAGLLTAAAAALGVGFDAKSTAAIVLTLACVIAWCLHRAHQNADGALCFATGLAPIALFALAAPGDFLDRAVFALAASFLVYLLIRRRDIVVATQRAGKPDAERAPVLAVVSTGKSQYLATNDIVYIKAARNYSELCLSDGSTVLDGRGLAALSPELPPSFFRIHRSYVANLDHAAAVTVAEGSRYRLEFTSGVSIPISRRILSDLKKRLGAP